MGLPGRRDEYWRFTDPATLNAPEAPAAAVFHEGQAALFDDVDRLRVVFVDGVFDAEASDPLAGEGLEIETAVGRHGPRHPLGARSLRRARGGGGSARWRGRSRRSTPPLRTDGVVIRATGKVARPVHLIYLHRNETSDAVLHHLVKVETGADLTLLETGPAAARFNKVTEVDVADGAGFHHVRAQGRDHERRAITHMFARLGARSTYKSFTLTVNGVLTRNEQVVEMTGDEAVAHVAGACVGDGDFLHDDTVFVTHDAVACESRQVFKKVLRNGATGVFQGKILVKPGAQQTDGYQISQSLLLDEDAQFLAKPELEIYADDVKCSHGSTSGAIDETALYYLRSRGVPQGEATDLLVLAFLAEALAEIEDQALADEMQTLLEGWLSRRRK